jgi:LytS/YehU family sensor histidine kinase
VEIQYAAITSQINPHFLFNSLNVLSSLIETDPVRANAFMREFARIYRYVLDSNERFVVGLEEEMAFVRSYLFLQKIRFGKGLVISEKLDPAVTGKILPPLSLQLLIENAIKHNEISEEHPLHIEIIGHPDRITVTNNYRPLPKKNDSSGGFGIRNLTERYAHYTLVKPEFLIENETYIATIPLLEDE